MRKAIVILENKYIDENSINELLRGGYTLYTTSLSIYNKYPNFTYDNSLAKILKVVIEKEDFFSFGEAIDQLITTEIIGIYPDIIIPSKKINENYYVESGPKEALIINSLLKNNIIESYCFAASLIDNEKSYHSVFALLQEANKFVILRDNKVHTSGIISAMTLNEILNQYSIVLKDDKESILLNINAIDKKFSTNCILNYAEESLLNELLQSYDIVYFRTKYKDKVIGCNITELDVSKGRNTALQKLNNASVAYATRQGVNISGNIENQKIIYIPQCLGVYDGKHVNQFMKSLDAPNNIKLLKKIKQKLISLVKKS